MTQTIDVIGTYTVDKGDDHVVTSEPAFRLMAGDEAPMLVCAGSVTVRSDTVDTFGVITDPDAVGSSGGGVGIEKGGSFTVRSTAGSATGFTLEMNDATFDNAGTVKVNAAAYAIGLWIKADGAVATNSGRFEINGEAASAAMTLGGASELTNTGEIIAISKTQGANGVSLLGGSHFDNQGLVKLDAEFGGFAVQMGLNATCENSGRILVTGHTGGGTGLSMFGDGSFHNSGTMAIHSADMAIGVIFGGTTDITNDGRIIASDTLEGIRSAGIWGGGSELHVTNTGLIQADDAILLFGGDVGVTVENSGKLMGDVTLADGSDQLNNTGGLIKGQVLMGAGNDVFLGGGGKLVGDIWGGDGDDTLSLGRTADHIFGGAGADTLSGGAGKDMFHYTDVSESHGASADLITDLDFHGARDRIDLSAIDADTGTDGDQAFHLVGAFGGHAGELTVSYDEDSDLTVVQGDIDGDGHADLRILLSGDHSGFTGFML